MKFSLVFNDSGDSIEFDAIQPDVVGYYVDWLDASGTNDFAVRAKQTEPLTHYDRSELRQFMAELKDRLRDEFGIRCLDDIDLTTDWYNQDKLNRIHECYVKACLKDNPNINYVLSETPDELHKFLTLNQGVHWSEKRWMARFMNAIHQPPEYILPSMNPFTYDITTFDLCNLSIMYNGLGRQTYNKWECFDENIDDVDTRNFEDLYGEIHLNLDRPRTILPPPEYVEYCTDHNVVAYGTHVALGNALDLPNRLGMYREIMHDNLIETQSNVRLEII